MKKLSLLFVYLFISLFVYLFIPLQNVAAVGEFQADYDNQYDVSPAGLTIVTQNVTLTNKITNLYPQKYSIVIDSEHIKDIIAYDDSGMIAPLVSQLNGKTQIVLPFNKQVIGVGKQLKFTLRYEDTDIAHQNGSIWEINIPGVSDDPDIATYAVSLHVPPSFGANAYLSPLPANGSRWTKGQMVRGGISAAYGTMQAFGLTLSYYVENVNVIPQTAEIALPPDTAYQNVILQSLDPKPKTVIRDEDGNWLARYDLLPAQRLDILAKITVLITLVPRAGVTETLSDPKPYLTSQKYWEVTNPQIQELAQLHKTPRDIYAFVVDTLSYDYNRVSLSPTRKGALAALGSPKNSICMEFTDLFVAIARAAGIPAREVVGYAYTTNARLRPLSLVSDVLHSWPEYYDSTKNIWIPVDPTWANTTGGVDYFDKLDFNHIAFAIHGISSDYPYPAGFYKKSGKNTKDVDVTFANIPQTTEEGKITASYVFPQTVTSGFPANGTVVLNNVSPVEIAEALVSIHSTPFDIALSRTYDHIPPLAMLSIPVSVQLPGYFLSGRGTLTTTVNGQETQFRFTIRPLVYGLVVPFIITATSLVLFAVIIAKTKGLWKRRTNR